jgi:phosphogluconate dehydratase
VGDQRGMDQYRNVPTLNDGELRWEAGPKSTLDPEIISSVAQPFAAGGGMHVMHGNLGRGISKTSAVAEKHQVVTAPAVVFDDQLDVVAAFKRGELEKDCIVVLRFQGPKANGMPELHKLTPILGLLQDRGFHVALITDGRMSGASGKVPSAIHMCPECMDGGPLVKVRDGDIIVLNTQTGEVNVQVDRHEFEARIAEANSATGHHYGMGRELFGAMRAQASSAETGATNLFFVD